MTIEEKALEVELESIVDNIGSQHYLSIDNKLAINEMSQKDMEHLIDALNDEGHIFSNKNGEAYDNPFIPTEENIIKLYKQKFGDRDMN